MKEELKKFAEKFILIFCALSCLLILLIFVLWKIPEPDILFPALRIIGICSLISSFLIEEN